MRTLLIGIMAALLVVGCTQSTEQPVTATTDETAEAVQQGETRMHDIEFNLIQGIPPQAVGDVMRMNAGNETVEAARQRANATIDPNAVTRNEATTAENAGAVNSTALAGTPIQQNSFYIEVWGDAAQSQQQSLEQAIEQMQTATQEVRSAVDIMIELQAQWTNTVKVLTELVDSLKASLVPTPPSE